MQKILIYIGAFWVSFLPFQYRKGFNLENGKELRPATIVSGLVQTLVCWVVYLLLFTAQITSTMGNAGRAVLETQTGLEMDELAVRLATGTLGLANFAFQPLNMFVLYLAAEGLIRTTAALVSHETLGTLPLYIVGWIRRRVDGVQHKKALGPLVADELQPAADPTHDIRVLSCRPKLEWNPYITVRFRSEFYVLVEEEIGISPRPFVYRLRKNPVGRLVVVIREYALDDPVKKPPYRGL